METRLIYIAEEPHDYKVCKTCDCINWHENEVCTDTYGDECKSKDFDNTLENVVDKVEELIKDYEQDYSRKEAENILTQV